MRDTSRPQDCRSGGITSTLSFRVSVTACLILLPLTGCSLQTEQKTAAKPPKPVTVMALETSQRTVKSEITGAVVAWKTEQIGFEVAGRIEFVSEPNELIEGRMIANGTTLQEGTPLARLKDQQYAIAVQSAQAAVTVSQRHMDAIRIDIEKRIPANIASVEAHRQLAQIERDRIASLYKDRAISQGELDQAETNLTTAIADLGKAEAEKATRQAELLSAEANLLQSQQQLADAQRNLSECVLYSSFGGQIAATHVTAGSHVNPGDPVLTVQMMDPLSIEFEVSAEESRRFSPGDTLRVSSMQECANKQEMTGHVYLVDAVADPQTRTFTVKLLVRNQQLQQHIPAPFTEEEAAFTRDFWPLNIGPILGGGHELFAEANAIHVDNQGQYVWLIKNRKMNQLSRANGPLEVQKIYVTAQPIEVPFLGIWKFVPIQSVDPDAFDKENDLIAGEILPAQSTNGKPAAPFNGTHLMLHQDNWQLRPGDLVRVSLQQESRSGWYVPMRILRHESGENFVYVIEKRGQETIAKRVNVQLIGDDVSFTEQATFQLIRPVNEGELDAESRIVSEGMHYLTDGDRVAIIPMPGDKE